MAVTRKLLSPSTPTRIRIRAPRCERSSLGTRHFSLHPTSGLLSHAYFIIYRGGIVVRLASCVSSRDADVLQAAPEMKTTRRLSDRVCHDSQAKQSGRGTSDWLLP